MGPCYYFGGSVSDIKLALFKRPLLMYDDACRVCGQFAVANYYSEKDLKWRIPTWLVGI